MSLFDSSFNLNTTQVVNRITKKLDGYIVGAVSSKLGDAVRKLGLNIPASIRGTLGFIFGETASFDPLQNLMFKVTLGNATFDDSHIKAVNIPHPTYKYRQQRQNGALNVNYIEGQDIGDLAITFYETTDALIANYYSQWTALLYNRRTGTFGYPMSYKRDIKVSLINSRGQEIFGFTFKGCSPKSISSYDMNTDGSAIVTPTITFAVDDCDLTIAGQDFGSLSGIDGFVNRLTSAAKSRVVSSIKGLIGI